MFSRRASCVSGENMKKVNLCGVGGKLFAWNLRFKYEYGMGTRPKIKFLATTNGERGTSSHGVK